MPLPYNCPLNPTTMVYNTRTAIDTKVLDETAFSQLSINETFRDAKNCIDPVYQSENLQSTPLAAARFQRQTKKSDRFEINNVNLESKEPIVEKVLENYFVRNQKNKNRGRQNDKKVTYSRDTRNDSKNRNNRSYSRNRNNSRNRDKKPSSGEYKRQSSYDFRKGSPSPRRKDFRSNSRDQKRYTGGVKV